MADRPLDGLTPRYPNFAVDDVQESPENGGQWNVQEPSPEVKATGWRRLERPPRYWLNWLHRLYNQWIQWFDQEVETAKTTIASHDGRLDTLETDMGTAKTTIASHDGRLDTLEAEVNTNVDGRLDVLETFKGDLTANYLAETLDETEIAFAGIGTGNVNATLRYAIHYPYYLTGGPKKVDFMLEGISGTASGTFSRFESGAGALPSAITPTTPQSFPIFVKNNSGIVPGMLYLNTTGKIMVQLLTTSDFDLTGTKGFWTDVFVNYVVG